MRKVSLIIIFIVIFSLLINGCEKQTNSAVFSPLSNVNIKQIHTSESFSEYNDTFVIKADYPITNIQTIDNAIKSKVETIINDFKGQTQELDKKSRYIYEKSALKIDYELYVVNDDCYSIVFKIFDHKPFSTFPNLKNESIVFSLKNENILNISDILQGNYLSELSNRTYNYLKNKNYQGFKDTESFKQAIVSKNKNFNNFYLKDDSLLLNIDLHNLLNSEFNDTTLEIPFEDIKDCNKTNQNATFNALPSTIHTHIAKAERNNDSTIMANVSNIESKNSREEVIEENKAAAVSNNESDKPKEEKVIEENNATVISDIAPNNSDGNKNIDPNKPMVALTFDDGPHEINTSRILKALKENNGCATFFLLGQRVPTNTKLIRQMLDQGCEIGNHSYNHKNLTKISQDELIQEIDSTQNEIYSATKQYPTLLRPPYGAYNDEIKSSSKLPLILWSIDTLDWKYKDADKIFNETMAKVKDGDIILMHDIYTTSATAAERLIKELTAQGYQLVTVSEMLTARGKDISGGKSYRSLYKK